MRIEPGHGARRARLSLAGILLAGTTLAIGGGPALAAQKTTGDCIVQTGAGPVDLNGLFGVSARIVIPPCNRIGSGESWTPGAVWRMNTTFAVVPAGFVAGGATPLDDFIAKFSGARYVIDPGTDEQKILVLSNVDKLFVGTLFGNPIVNSVTMATLKPLSVGQHVVAVYWRFSAMHCDGFGDAIIGVQITSGVNCITGGEHLYWAFPFTVTADQH